MENKLDKLIALTKRRGFIYPGSEIYGGLANSYDYGPLGVELKNNIMQLWWKRFVQSRDDMVGIDAAVIMNPKVWARSGHLAGFSDPLVECKKCHERYRDTDIISPGEYMPRKRGGAGMKEEIEQFMKTHQKCPNCGGREFTKAKQFNLMFKTFIGPVDPLTSIWEAYYNFQKDKDESKFVERFNESVKAQAYLRPEIAQAMFVNFKQVLDTARKRLPFGIASQGKAFRNEITPGNFIFRTREFNLMEFEYFVRESEWEKWFTYWQNEMREWLKELGVNLKHIHEMEIAEEDRAHYSKRTVDFEYDYPFGQKELYGLAYRTDFDLKNHFKEAPYRDPETGEEFYPHVIEPTFGLDRSILVTLLEAYTEEGERIFLKLPPKLAPYKAAVFPLLANKPDLIEKARSVFDLLKHPTSNFPLPIVWDDRGNIGKRYYSQDEIGTPFCITVDFESLENNDATVRNRDTAKQERIKIAELANFLKEKLS